MSVKEIFLFDVLIVFLKMSIISGIPKEALLSGRLVSGETALENQFPFIASIRINSIHYCSGAILNAEWILTAAHCRFDIPLKDYSVVVSATKLNAKNEFHKIKKFILHEEYDSVLNDIALIKLNGPLLDPIVPIKLPGGDLADNEVISAIGWGYTTSPATTPNDLMWIRLRSVHRYECEISSGSELHPGQFCTYTKRGLGVCSGDTGGPITANGYIYGIAVWTKPCTFEGKPDIFTRVYHYKDWIRTIIELNS